MPKKVTLFLFCFFSISYSFAQMSSIDLNSLIEKYKEEQNSAVISTDFTQRIKAVSSNISQKNTLTVIEKVLLAQTYARQLDALNDKSTRLFKEATLLSDKVKSEDLSLWTYTQHGNYYYQYSEYLLAMPFFLQASKIIDSALPKKFTLQTVDILKKNAYYLGTIGNPEQSNWYLHAALKLIPEKNEESNTLLFALGTNFKSLKTSDSALYYFEKGKEQSLRTKDYIRYAKNLGELALIAMNKTDYLKAQKLLEEDIRISKKYSHERNTMYAQIMLAKVHLKQNLLDKARLTIKETQKYTQHKPHLRSFYSEGTEVLLEIAKRTRNQKEELATRRSLDSLNALLELTDGEAAINKANLETRKEKYAWQLDSKKEEINEELFAKRITIFLAILVFIISCILIRIYQKRTKKQSIEFDEKMRTFNLHRIQSEEKLNQTHNTLQSYKTYLLEKNVAIEELEEELVKIRKSSSPSIKQKENLLTELLNSHVMTKESWLQFKNAFVSEQGEYYNNLVLGFPDLTESNIRIILLQKMGLDKTNMAKVLGVTPDAVKKSLQRLRKKYDTKSLSVFLDENEK